ncbi:protein phosphatase 1 regulatory subunit 3A isoform X2 [Gouania willdenowi]|uniref:protein phosphatase 1 regulatory subunit 3A isoform X2 n=1 Tax=Gouania willdenowi TaxID=441366 RepID=UPI0010553F2C|nr:protein phosphatase 1 regulatory subunit 3A-like isoform X2 [Gouania willdenowi]
MSFLTIPSQGSLFRAIKTNKSGDGEGRSKDDDEGNCNNDDDDEEEDDDTAVRLIPRCSPIPRRRGQSISDETAEYLRIHQALSGRKKLSFADTIGGDLVDVKEFVAFDSDDEEASAKWEAEEAKYRRLEQEPIYQVHTEFSAPSPDALLRAVRDHKVEVEQICPVSDEPLAISGVIRVLNVSFHKSVYIRSTFDGWATYYDYPAEYVVGSHDGTTDQFSFKLSFTPPYITHGSRIEFVVRYETSDGDFWANNSSMNYAVTLLLSYEDITAKTHVDTQHLRSILKPPKVYSTNTASDSDDEKEKETFESVLVRPRAVCPVIIQPEIDIELIEASADT